MQWRSEGKEKKQKKRKMENGKCEFSLSTKFWYFDGTLVLLVLSGHRQKQNVALERLDGGKSVTGVKCRSIFQCSTKVPKYQSTISLTSLCFLDSLLR